MKMLIVAFALASQMKMGTAETVLHNRQNGHAWVPLPPQAPLVDGFIATEDCRHVGEVWYLRPETQKHYESFWVIDCSGDEATTEWLEANNILVEVDYQTAKRWDTVGKGIKIVKGLKIPRGLLE